ncbi:MAG: shikimate dehydrogenase [Promethearchaeota archaeon]
MANEWQVSGKTGVLCVIGDPIEHTISPAMHNAAIKVLGLDLVYVAFHVKSSDLKSAVDGFRALGIRGINVTIPHKVAIIEYMDEIDDVARGIGAINTIKNEDGILKAKNTDADGAVKALEIAGIDYKKKKIFILGAGGAARAVGFALARDADNITVSAVQKDRHMATNLAAEIKAFAPDTDINDVTLDEENLKGKLKDFDLLINATPVGMYPKIDGSLVRDEWLHENLAVFDVVYNPFETKLLKQAKQKNCKIAFGLDMLIYQGAMAFEWWTGKKPPIDAMKNAALRSLGLK